MEKKPNSLRTRTKKTKYRDPCDVCGKELYYNSKYSQRVGLFDMKSIKHDIIGWQCPYCKSEFDINDNIMYIYGQDYVQGKS